MASAGEDTNHQTVPNSNQANAAVANANTFVSGSDNHNHLNNVEMDEFERMLAGNSGQQQMRQL